MFNFESILYSLPGIIIAMTVHEYAHARVANELGDPTAKALGRLTLNPLAHIDPMGMIMLFFTSFGWANPVPFNPNYFKNPRKSELYVALAGPAINLFCAFVTLLLTAFLLKYKMIHSNSMASYMLSSVININVGFAVFNMLPLGPLDGARVFRNILPRKFSYYLDSIEPYSNLILLGLLIVNYQTGLLLTLMRPILSLLNLIAYFILTF